MAKVVVSFGVSAETRSTCAQLNVKYIYIGPDIIAISCSPCCLVSMYNTRVCVCSQLFTVLFADKMNILFIGVAMSCQFMNEWLFFCWFVTWPSDRARVRCDCCRWFTDNVDDDACWPQTCRMPAVCITHIGITAAKTLIELTTITKKKKTEHALIDAITSRQRAKW